MQMSSYGLQHLMQSEGFINYVYDDGAGNATIGVGHLLTQDELYSGKIALSGGSIVDIRKETISDDDVRAILADDVQSTERCVNQLVAVPLTQSQFDALVSFTFNVGCGALSRSTLLELLNRADYNSVPDQLRRWTQAKGKQLQGLVNRREREAELWQGSQASRSFDAVKPIIKQTPPQAQTRQPTDYALEAELHSARVEAVNNYRRTNTKPALQSRTVRSGLGAIVTSGLLMLVTQFGAPDWLASDQAAELVLSLGSMAFSALTIYFRRVIS